MKTNPLVDTALCRLLLFLLFLTSVLRPPTSAHAATAKVAVNTATHALVIEDGSSIIDAKNITFTLGGLTISDTSGVKTVVTGSANGVKFGATGDKIGFLGATPIVRPGLTTDIRQALINLGLLTTGGASPLNLNGGIITADGSGLTNIPNGALTLNNGALQGTFVGYQAGAADISGSQNSAFGYRALPSSNDTYSSAFGYRTLELSIAHANTAFGAGAGRNVTTGYDNVFMGADAGADRYSRTGIVVTGHNNTAMGNHTLGYLTSGNFNVALGSAALEGGPDALSGSPLTGYGNMAIGYSSLYNTGGSSSENVAIGYNPGASLALGNQNIFIGGHAGSNLTGGNLNIAIGRDVRLPSATGNAQLNIGNLITGSGLTQGGEPANGAVAIHGTLTTESTLSSYGSVTAGNAPPSLFSSLFYGYSPGAPYLYLSDGTIAQNYGGAFKGYSAALQGGRAGIGAVNNGEYIEGLWVDHLGNAYATHAFTVAGNLAVGGAILAPTLTRPVINARSSAGNADVAVDVSADSTIAIANNATGTPLGNANNFTGLLIVTAGNGQSAVFLCGSFGAMNLISQTGGNFGVTPEIAPAMNVYLVSNVVTIQNKMGGTVTFKVMALRTQASN